MQKLPLTKRQKQVLPEVIKELAKAYEIYAAKWHNIEMEPMKLGPTGRLQLCVKTRVRPQYQNTMMALDYTYYLIHIGKRGKIESYSNKYRDREKDGSAIWKNHPYGLSVIF